MVDEESGTPPSSRHRSRASEKADGGWRSRYDVDGTDHRGISFYRRQQMRNGNERTGFHNGPHYRGGGYNMNAVYGYGLNFVPYMGSEDAAAYWNEFESGSVPLLRKEFSGSRSRYSNRHKEQERNWRDDPPSSHTSRRAKESSRERIDADSPAARGRSHRNGAYESDDALDTQSQKGKRRSRWNDDDEESVRGPIRTDKNERRGSRKRSSDRGAEGRGRRGESKERERHARERRSTSNRRQDSDSPSRESRDQKPDRQHRNQKHQDGMFYDRDRHRHHSRHPNQKNRVNDRDIGRDGDRRSSPLRDGQRNRYRRQTSPKAQETWNSDDGASSKGSASPGSRKQLKPDKSARRYQRDERYIESERRQERQREEQYAHRRDLNMKFDRRSGREASGTTWPVERRRRQSSNLKHEGEEGEGWRGSERRPTSDEPKSGLALLHRHDSWAESKVASSKMRAEVPDEAVPIASDHRLDSQLASQMDVERPDEAHYALSEEEDESDMKNDLQTAPVIRARPDEVYEQVAQVGEGTYGQVYKAKADKSGIVVALKKIRMEAEKDGFPITAMREIKLLQGLRHENVVRLHEIMLSKSSVYMVFEYLQHDLNGILSQNAIVFHPAHLKSLAKQLLCGLAYLHRHSILHRDLKGSNLLLSSNGTLKLADFGLARRYTKRAQGNLDYTNRVVTLWYRPPELLFGETCYDDAIDVWGAGCIFLELFTRKPAFQGNDEIHQVQVLLDLLGPIEKHEWPQVDSLPWYDLIRPQQVENNSSSSSDAGDKSSVKIGGQTGKSSSSKSRIHELFADKMPADALDVASVLLSYNPARRVSAEDALRMDYFTHNLPRPRKPRDVLEKVMGEWHEFETRQARRVMPPTTSAIAYASQQQESDRYQNIGTAATSAPTFSRTHPMGPPSDSYVGAVRTEQEASA